MGTFSIVNTGLIPTNMMHSMQYGNKQTICSIFTTNAQSNKYTKINRNKEQN